MSTRFHFGAFKLIAASTILSTLLACWTTPVAANLLSNPGFESGTVGVSPDDWGAFNFGTFSTQETAFPRSGAHSIKMGSAGTASGSTGVFQAVLGVIPGETYTFSIWARSEFDPFTTDDIPLGVNMQLEWFPDPLGTSTGGMLSENVLSGMASTLDTTYQQYTIVAVAPAGAGHVRPVFRARHVSSAVFWDDAELTAVLPPDTPAFSITVDRGTGNISLNNVGTGDGSIKEVRITSASGALDPISWTSIAGNYDSSNGGLVDADDNWTQQTATNGELRETGNDPSDGGVVLEGASINLGNGAWIKSLTEDLVAEIVYADNSAFRAGLTNGASVSFTGGPNGGDSFERSDLNFDGEIDAADWPLLRDKLFTASISTTSDALAYQSGDLNGDEKADFGDFNLFKADFNAANGGQGAFAAMIASVPEPSTLAMLAFGAFGLSFSRKRRPASLLKAVCLLAIVGVVAPATTYAADVNFTNYTVDYYPLIKPDAFDRFQVPTYTTTSSQAVQDVSSNPHVFYGTQSILNKRITGTINPGADNDFIGLALGYTAGDVTHLDPAANPTGADFLLLDWKFDDSTQEMDDPSGGFFFHRLTDAQEAKAGVALSRVTGTPSGDELWGHVDIVPGFGAADYGGVTQLQRGAASGSTGYVKNQDHVFDITYTATNVIVKIDGTEEINVAGSFADGVLGLYSMDQSEANGAPTYSNFKVTNIGEGLLTAVVNTLSGSVTLTNTTADAITLNGYTLESSSSSLDAGTWNSLQDQNLTGFEAGNGTGNGWEEQVNSNDAILIEANLANISTLGAGQSVSLGLAFDTSGSQDLAFNYDEGNGLVSTGLISYVSSPEDADFDSDSKVDGDDFLTWQRGFGNGTTLATGDANNSGNVDAADLAIWNAQYGTGALSGAEGVPEPSSALMLIFAACGLGISRSRR